MNNNYTVYVHTFPNGKKYVGITKLKPTDRWRYGYNRFMTNAIKKYGWENVSHEIVESSLSKKDAEELEKTLIKKYKSNNREYGYNILSGTPADSGYPFETRNKMCEAHKGKKHTEETIEKIRTWNIGRKMSDESKKKNSNSHKKAVLCIEQNIVYDSAISASNAIGISRSAISLACLGKTQTAGGFHWKFEEV